MGLLNYSTKKEAQHSSQEIQNKLSIHCAKDITSEYDDDFVLIRFTKKSDLQTNNQKCSYRVKLEINPVFELLKSQKRVGIIKIPITYVQAKRVAWRILKRWIEAQLAFVETGMIKFEEVFLAYKIEEDTGMNLIESFREKQLILSAANEDIIFLPNGKE